MLATAAPQLRDVRFRAMGTDVHLAVVGGDDHLLRIGESRVHELECRWSRFIETSEINALNRRAGQSVVVSIDTFDLVTRAVAAWRSTRGRFDPTVGATLAAYGYDRDFASVADTIASVTSVGLPPGPGGVSFAPRVNAVTLPVGVTLDPGGIGKGLAADLTVQLLLEAGARGALANIGGDLRVQGEPPAPEGWVVNVADPFDADRELLRVAMPDGAVATSSRLQRRWNTTAGPAHHLIDPRTGAPATTDVVAVTVVAGEAWWAEALTKALFLAGPDALDDFEDLHAVIVTSDGTRHATPDLEATLR
ncbi:MAG TPA: FAD:protein FMN transferase [Acidimicrobiales bacterium]|nr:FAD:protein FMN transferase [Acidimicrobiales bacterium]